MRLPSEKKPATQIETGYFANESTIRAKWVGIFQSPFIGVKYVRKKSGEVESFDSRERAEKAALSALMSALNSPRERLKVTRERDIKTRATQSISSTRRPAF